MYIIQLADLHIGSADKCSEKEEEILSKGIEKIKRQIPKNQKILICVCGDIIDSKKLSSRNIKTASSRYKTAGDLFCCLNNELKRDYDIKFGFCLGNHDVTHIKLFVNCIKMVAPNISEEEINDGYFIEWGGIYYIFANSCNGRQYKYGNIDYNKLEQILRNIPLNKPKIVVLHHAIISMYDKDVSSIRDSAKLLSLIEKYRVFGVLHGHVHGREHFSIGYKQCRMIGVGALFSRNHKNVNSQFNIIEAESDVFREVSTFIYTADGRIGEEPWHKIYSEKDSNENYFQGEDFKDVYKRLITDLKYKQVLNNVVLCLNCSYEKFSQDLKEMLQDEKLTIGEKHFSYFELAEKWEAIKAPQELYFNHGEYFKVRDENKGGKEVHGIEFIARQLLSKPTSNKAVLTTYNMDTVSKMLKGEEYLPSLLSIQFSQSKDRQIIYVHMYLRALEAERFLKINICEIYWLLEQLLKESITFTTVDIAISAFRVQIREKFNCFVKADIDAMDEKELADIVKAGNLSKICEMLKEKMDASETITNVSGLKALYKIMEESNTNSKQHQYSEKTINKLNNVLQNYKELDDLHKRGSEKTEAETSYEAEIAKGIEELIIELEEGR